jgi:parafibromin
VIQGFCSSDAVPRLRTAMSVTDPLIALRSAIQAKYDVSYVSGSGEAVLSLQAATDLRLSPTLTLPKAAPTRFRKPSATALDPHTAPNDFVTLESLLVAWLARDASVAEYMKQVREAGIGAFVSITERKGVVEWLEGKVLDHERIVPLPGGLFLVIPPRIRLTDGAVEEPTTPPGMPPQGSTTPQNQAGLSATPGSPSKRRYVPDTSDVDVVKKIKREEVELRDRTSVLRGIKPNVRLRHVLVDTL